MFNKQILLLSCFVALDVAGAVAIGGCTSMRQTAHYRRSMDEDSAGGRAPASESGGGSAAVTGAGATLASYACASSDSKTKFSLNFGAEKAAIFMDGGGRGELFDAQPGEINAPAETEVLAVDGLGDANTLYYVALPKQAEFAAKLTAIYIVKKTGEAQVQTETVCNKN